MQKRFSLLMTSLSCFALGSCKDVSLGGDVGGRDGGNDGLVQTEESGSGGVLATGRSESGGNNGSGGGPGAVTCGETSLIASASHNYTFSGTVTLVPVTVAPNAELIFDWAGVTMDLRGRAGDPKKDLNTISMLMWELSPSDLQAKLNADTMQTKDLTTIPLTFNPDGNTTSARLFSFTVNGQAIDPNTILPYFDSNRYSITNHVYTLMATTGSVIGQDTRMIQSFQLDPSSSNTTVKMTSTSTKLTYAVDLRSLTPTVIPAGQPAITLDWSQMTINALGSPFDSNNISKAMVGHYTQTLSELERAFPNLELLASELYQGDIPVGTSSDFSLLKSTAGQRFSGIDGTGTWIVALQCGGCVSPAPWYLSILKPCSN